ncbi:MAG: hypothetical protein KGM17_03670 [Sphingomonadales bacterium]|nr:hypothetical protein [Sphingomonadales bacterium]
MSKARIKAARALGQQAECAPGEGAPATHARRKGAEANRRKADEFMREMLPVIEAIRREGKASCNAIALGLNQRGLRTARGGAWTGAAVRAVLNRAGASEPA